MQVLYSQCLPILGVNRNIGTEWRMLPERYQGLGMPNYVMLCFAAKVFICCVTGVLTIQLEE